MFKVLILREALLSVMKSVLLRLADDKYWFLHIFWLAIFIRGLPELLSGPYPVGYDLLAGYAPSILALPEVYTLKVYGWLWFPLSPLILWFFWQISRIDIFLFLKIVSPIFYGLFSTSFYYLLSKGLKWNRKKSLFTALLFLLQPGVLRIGWDQLRLMLGLILFFVLLAETEGDLIAGSSEKPLTVAVLSILLVLSQQLAAILLFVIVSWQLSRHLLRKRAISRESTVLLPSAVLFASQLYLSYFTDLGSSIRFAAIQLPSGSEFFAFMNYFVADPRFIGGDYFKILAYVGSLSIYVVVPLIPLAAKGFFKDKTLLPMLIWLLAASYSIILFPWFALSYYWFWTFLLPIPLTIYSGHALDKLGAIGGGKRFKRLVVGFLLLGIVGFGYASSAISIGYPFAYAYMPPGLVKSCVDFEDIPLVQKAFIWADANLPANATVVIPENFQGFASMYSRPDLGIRVAPALLSFEEAVELLGNDSSNVFAVYHSYDVKTSSFKVEPLTSYGTVGVFTILL